MFEKPESRLRFRFEAPWRLVEKWDEHDCYTSGLHRYPTTAAVDFIGLYGSEPYFIEVKNFRKYRIENKRRLTSGELVEEVADKVRDTVAGMVWAMDRGFDTSSVAPLLAQLFEPQEQRRRKCNVVLWLEEDLQPRPADRSALAQGIKRRLRWFNPKVIVLDREGPGLPGLRVTGAPHEVD